MMELCIELENFLTNKQTLKYDESLCECGKVSLKDIDELSIEIIEVELEEEYYPSTEQVETGPFGHYEIEAVNLVKSCEGYSPDFILLWLPKEKKYGTYDTDHSNLFIFDNVSWKDISRNPVSYINSQWNDFERKISKHFDPRSKYKIVYED